MENNATIVCIQRFIRLGTQCRESSKLKPQCVNSHTDKALCLPLFPYTSLYLKLKAPPTEIVSEKTLVTFKVICLCPQNFARIYMLTPTNFLQLGAFYNAFLSLTETDV